MRGGNVSERADGERPKVRCEGIKVEGRKTSKIKGRGRRKTWKIRGKYEREDWEKRPRTRGIRGDVRKTERGRIESGVAKAVQERVQGKVNK